MPVNKRRFVSFDLLSESNLARHDVAHCAAHMKNGERCTTQLKSDAITRVGALHGKLTSSDGSAIDDETMEALLEQVARLAICGRQNNKRAKGVIEAAVEQWKSELLESQAYVNNHKDSSKLIFTPYKTSIDDDKIAEELNELVDTDIAGKLIAGGWKHDRGFLYIIKINEAPGMFKLGYTNDVGRRASEHTKCYPGASEGIFFRCPNALRFESILKMEFAQNRYKHECKTCKGVKEHTEWFKVDLKDFQQRVKVWCKFAEGICDDENRSQVAVPLAGFSQDPDRWYKLVQGYIELWKGKSSLSEPNTPEPSFVEEENAIEPRENSNLTGEDDLESVPPLSPPSSAPGSPGDCYSDPPTPPPVKRSPSAKPPPFPPLDTSRASQIDPPEEYFSAVEKMPDPEDPDFWCQASDRHPLDTPINPV
ncbi:hypothetical protein BDW69DRAFT_196686 [Aspergillus filifer]